MSLRSPDTRARQRRGRVANAAGHGATALRLGGNNAALECSSGADGGQLRGCPASSGATLLTWAMDAVEKQRNRSPMSGSVLLSLKPKQLRAVEAILEQSGVGSPDPSSERCSTSRDKRRLAQPWSDSRLPPVGP
jgi:hypothetical protein